ncbi:MAG: 1-deoxy-D-xylulose-5-phosphate synthase [Bacteroidota bacterium]
MYIENKPDGVTGYGRIGRVTFSKTLRSMYYDGKEFLKVKNGFKHNCIDIETGEEYWISGCKKDGDDTLYGGNKSIEIDEDAREEYWTVVRNRPDLMAKATSN